MLPAFEIINKRMPEATESPDKGCRRNLPVRLSDGLVRAARLFNPSLVSDQDIEMRPTDSRSSL